MEAARSLDGEGQSSKASDGNEDQVTGQGKVIPVITWQGAWLGCAYILVLCGRQNLGAMKWGMWVRTFLCKVLQKQLGCS